jgi:hypothetical protein
MSGNGDYILQNMNFAVEMYVILWEYKLIVSIFSDNTVSVIPYKQIKADFKDELIEFFEKKARPLDDKSNT